jgi:hypothetical protein
MEDSDCIVVMGSNMAENHPVAFRWPMKAKVERGARLIHADPRFTRTRTMADIYAPIRAGSDVAFLGGLINYVLNSPRWNSDPFFKRWVGQYTNAATLIREEFRGTEELDGVFSGLMEYKGGIDEWPFNALTAEYENESWQYARTEIHDQGRVASTAQSGETRKTKSGQEDQSAPAEARPPFDDLVKGLRKPMPESDPTLAHPRSVLQIVKRHISRYTPEMVERTTGCPRDTFLRVAETILNASGADRTTSFAYAVAWTGAHERRADHRRVRAAAAPARQRRPARCGRHGAARPRFDPGNRAGRDGRPSPDCARRSRRCRFSTLAPDRGKTRCRPIGRDSAPCAVPGRPSPRSAASSARASCAVGAAARRGGRCRFRARFAAPATTRGSLRSSRKATVPVSG